MGDEVFVHLCLHNERFWGCLKSHATIPLLKACGRTPTAVSGGAAEDCDILVYLVHLVGHNNNQKCPRKGIGRQGIGSFVSISNVPVRDIKYTCCHRLFIIAQSEDAVAGLYPALALLGRAGPGAAANCALAPVGPPRAGESEISYDLHRPDSRPEDGGPLCARRQAWVSAYLGGCILHCRQCSNRVLLNLIVCPAIFAV